MTHLEFFPYHNYHIRFRLINGTELSGVLVDSMDGSTVYKFIPTKSMIEWKQADKIGDKEKVKSLEQKIDIANIVWAERLKY